MTILLLMRHATNDYVKEGRLAGRTPGVHINAQGQREADDLARRTAHVKLEAIYSSPLERAIDTANAVAACHRLPVEIVNDLIETNAGEWTGRKISEINGTDTWKAIQTKPVGVPLPGGGESIDQVQARMVNAIETIRKKHPDGVVAIVSHADPLKSVVAHYTGTELNNFQRFHINPASVTVIAANDEGATLLKLNDTGPLPKFEKIKPEPKPEIAGTAAPEGEGKPEAEKKDERTMAEANIVFDLNPVSRVTVGTVGEPGHRTFYLQARQGTTLVTLVTEKEQMNALSQGITDLLMRLGDRADAPTNISEYELTLEEPLDPIFRIGQLGLGFDQEADLLVIVAYAIPETEDAETVDAVRIWGTRDQMRALGQHVTRVSTSGRPICVLCGRPIDPEGHFCPRRNGHASQAQVI